MHCIYFYIGRAIRQVFADMLQKSPICLVQEKQKVGHNDCPSIGKKPLQETRRIRMNPVQLALIGSQPTVYFYRSKSFVQF